MAKQNKSKNDGPTMDAPMSESSSQPGAGAPEDLADVMSVSGTNAVKSSLAPSLTPPGEEVLEADEGAGASAWHNGKKITAMWCNSSARNSYAAVEGLGWRRINNANDGSWISMTMLCSHAEQTNSNCNIRTESDNKIHEVYVW